MLPSVPNGGRKNLAQWIFPVARIGALDQPRIWRRELMNTILLQKQIKPLAVMQGLSPL
jgi:hypothetical protein